VVNVDPSEPGQLDEATPRTGLWQVVDGLVRQLDAETARAHGVVPLMAQLQRNRGEEVSAELLHEERAARMTNAIAPSVLARARAAYDGPMLLLKGPEVSALYPGQARMLADLDLLASDAHGAWDALRAAGFVQPDRLRGVSSEFFHLDPLELPGIPLQIELHKTFGWPSGLHPPRNEALFEAAVPASVGVPGVLAPARAHHALLLAGHAWNERPLERLRDFIDIGVMAEPIDRRELTAIATEWGWDRLWRTTRRVLDWLFGDGEKPPAVRLWARHLPDLRVPTRTELQLRRYLAPFWAMPAPTALHESAYQAKLSLTRSRSPAQ